MKNKNKRTPLKPEILTIKITVPLQRLKPERQVRNGRLVLRPAKRLLENFDWPMPHFNGMTAKDMIAFQILAQIDRAYSQYFSKVEVK